MGVIETLLIVDDNADLAAALARSLIRRGYVAHIEHSTEAALRTAPGLRPQAAVVDLRMGGASGLECVKGLAALDPDMRIVVLTGYASITTAVEAVKLGACHYLAKPANAGDILAAFGRSEGVADVEIAARPTSLKNLEWERINEVLAETDYNISETARRLGLHRRTLARKLAKRPIS
ncbi:MAG TPA: response regulator [Asticcacaulis sp.]|nr:response regulator [Asticcacaulis sp.]